MSREPHIHRAPKPNYRGLLFALMERLRSDQYPCPGCHGTEPHSGDRHYNERLENYQADHMAYDPRLGSCALCGNETYEGFPDPDFARPILAEYDMPLPDGYVGLGECKKQITIETDAEYLEYSATPFSVWPVASGPCSEALGLDDDDECDDKIFERWAERRSLLKSVERMARQFHVDLYPYRPGRGK